MHGLRDSGPVMLLVDSVIMALCHGLASLTELANVAFAGAILLTAFRAI